MINDFQTLKISISNHIAINHPLFSYLNNDLRQGFSKKQFKVYWYNYLLRTLNTIPSVANVVKAAALNRDMENLALAGKNLWEETGKGNEFDVHINLLINAHNVHAYKVFQLNPVDLVNLKYAEEIIPETHEFLKIQNYLYTSSSYNVVVGANYAQESAASSMLSHFYNAFFKKYENHYQNTQSFTNITKYFDEHLDGTEEQHALNAEKIVQKRYNDRKNISEISYGVDKFLKAQSQLWDGLLKKLKSLDISDEIVEF
jgi:pyrroloquinoline quinone (PQQ) biosynthesis protein C